MLLLRDLTQRYPDAEPLRLPDLALADAEHALLLGPSGSGKTTLLHLAAGLLRPASGTVRLDDTDLAALGESARDRFRGRHIGIVYQRLHLIPSLSVRQNLLAAQFCAGLAQDRGTIDAVLAGLGLADRAEARPAALSQGQAQRVAIARALVNRPRLIVADEPTSSLDDANAATVLALLRDQARAAGAMLLIATHDARAKAAVARHVMFAAPALAPALAVAGAVA